MLALDTTERFEKKLYEDEPKSEAVFVFRFLTAREYRDALVTLNLSDEESSFSVKAYDALFESLRVNMVDWRGVGEVFDIERLEDILTMGEATALFYASLQAGHISVAEKNESGSASDVNSEPSAEDAGQENV